nr:VWA domain-containing protein [Saccharibacillus sp. JS10]
MIVFAIYAFRGSFRISKFRHRLAATFRTFALLLLVLLIAGIQIYSVERHHEVVYAVDRSSSNEANNQDRTWISSSLAQKSSEDQFSVISFGRNASVEQTWDTQPTLGSLDSSVDADYTNIERALQLASGMFKSGDSRIVLLSDGNENIGQVEDTGRLLRNRGIKIDVLEKHNNTKRDTAIDSLNLPGKLYVGESFTVEARLTSTFSGTGEITLYEDRVEIGKQTVRIEKGENSVLLQGLAKSPGLHRYRAELNMPGDEQSANNAAFAFTRVSGNPSVLVVEGKPNTSANITNALNAGLIDTTVIVPGQLPSEIADYAKYDSVIFNNVSGDSLGQSKMETIETAVRSYGIGFMMSGGDQSFGLGGYFDTPIEQALPVSMELEGKREVPELGLILVIDRSGSMSGSKIELSKEAAMRTVELMRSKDTVGVVAFDDTPWWVVEPQKLTDKEAVLDQIQSIPSAGGTNIYPAMASAAEAIQKIKAQRKHIILMTDGQSAGGGSYEELLNTLAQNKVTVSSVAVGSDADRGLLQMVANLGKGRFYDVQDETTLPAIFSREAVLLARTYVVDKPFTPALASPGDWASLFAKGVPNLNGYIATTAKPSAQTALVSPEPDPVLVRWQYGSGRSVAWTSDLTGEWSKSWVSWDEFANTLTQMVKWTFPQFSASPYVIETSRAENGTELVVTATDSPSNSQPDELIASIGGGDNDETRQSVSLVQTSPGRYTGILPILEPGAYLLNLASPDEENVAVTETAKEPAAPVAVGTGLVIPYSPEYEIDLNQSEGKSRLAELANLTGGRVLSWDDPAAVYAQPAAPHKQMQDWTSLLLAMVLVLWIADIAIRRLAFPWERLAAWAAAPLAAMRRRSSGDASDAAASTEASVLARLSTAKRRSVTFRGGEKSAAEELAAPPKGAAGKSATQPSPRAEGGELKSSQTGIANAAARLRAERESGGASQPRAASEETRGSASSGEPISPEKPASAKPPEPGGSAMERLLAAKKRGGKS